MTQANRSFVPDPAVTASPRYVAGVELCARIRALGGEAYLVGGSVRDLLLDPAHPPHDLDIATSLAPKDLRTAFKGTELVGQAFGVCIVPCRGFRFDVATFREDGPYTNRRHPDFVREGTLMQDSLRRDFTINALYFNPLDNSLVDPHGGVNDLDARILRCVGDARARLHEDALRVVRLARFAAGLGFSIDLATADAARAEADGLTLLSRERFLTEFAKVKPGAFNRFMDLLEELGALAKLLPAALLNIATAEPSRSPPQTTHESPSTKEIQTAPHSRSLSERNAEYPWLCFALHSALRLRAPARAFAPWEKEQASWPVPRSDRRAWKFLGSFGALEDEYSDRDDSSAPEWLARAGGLWDAEPELQACDLRAWIEALFPHSCLLPLFGAWAQIQAPREGESAQSWWRHLSASAVPQETTGSAFREIETRQLPASTRTGWIRIAASQAALALILDHALTERWRRPLAASGWSAADEAFLIGAAKKSGSPAA